MAIFSKLLLLVIYLYAHVVESRGTSLRWRRTRLEISAYDDDDDATKKVANEERAN